MKSELKKHLILYVKRQVMKIYNLMKRKVPEETKQKILQNSSVNPPYNPKAV